MLSSLEPVILWQSASEVPVCWPLDVHEMLWRRIRSDSHCKRVFSLAVFRLREAGVTGWIELFEDRSA